MTLYKNVNGQDVPLSADEEAAYNALQSDWEAGENGRLVAEFTTALGNFVDAVATQKSYANAVSCASYVNSTNPTWVNEAKAFVAWRDSAFSYGYQYQSDVESGVIQNPNIKDFLAGVPVLTWPD